MKKLAFICVICLAACTHTNDEGTYVGHFESEYSVTDDTLIIDKGVVTNITGFNRILNGKLGKRTNKTKLWRLNEPGSPVIRFTSDGLLCGTAQFKKIK